MTKVIVVGGGIAGLTAAFRLCEHNPVRLLEAAQSPGGQIRTEHSAGFAIERGAEGFVFRSEAIPALAADLGLSSDLMGQSVTQSYGFGDGGLRRLAPGEAAAFLDFQVPPADLGRGIRTFRRGMASIVEALRAHLQEDAQVRCGAKVRRIEPTRDGVTVTLNGGQQHDAERVIVATGAREAASLLALPFGEAVAGLSRAPTLSSVTVELAFARSQIDHPLDGTGIVVALDQQKDGLRACTFTSAKFAERSPANQVSLRMFFRPSTEQLERLSDDLWVESALSGIERLLPVDGPPLRTWVSRWPSALPVFNDEHRAAVEQAESALTPRGIIVAGSAFHGAGIDAAVRSGEAAATMVTDDSG